MFFEKVMYALEIEPTALEATEGNCIYALSKRSTTDLPNAVLLILDFNTTDIEKE